MVSSVARPMLQGLLLGQGQRRDRPRRADLPAERAAVLAVAQARHEHGGPQAREPGLIEGRLQGVRRAGLHAQAALHAALQELGLSEGARRPDQLGVVGLAPGQGRQPEEDERTQTGQRRAHQRAAADVHARSRRPPPGRLPAEVQGVLPAARHAVPAAEALGRQPLAGLLRLRGGGTAEQAALAVAALPRGREAQGGAPRAGAEQSAERAQVTAPEARAQQVEQQQADEDEEDQRPAAEDQVLPGEDAIPPEAVERLAEGGQVRRAQVRIGLVDAHAARLDGPLQRGQEARGAGCGRAATADRRRPPSARRPGP